MGESRNNNNSTIDIATKLSHQVELNSKFTKNTNQGNAPKASDILNIVKNNTTKKGSD